MKTIKNRMQKKQLTKAEIIEAHLRQNVKSKDVTMAKVLKKTYPSLFQDIQLDTLRKRIGEARRELSLPRPVLKTELKPVEQAVEDDRMIRKLSQTTTDYKLKYHHLLKLTERQQEIIDLFTKIKSLPKSDPIVVNKSIGKSQATVLSLLSDIHIEERVDKLSVNGLNEYNPDIGKRRTLNYFTNLVKLIKKERQGVIIENLVIGMVGDLIHGFIHEEYQQSNYMTPIEASLYIYEILLQGFTYILENDVELKNIVVICKVGNHSRTTDKVYTDSEALMSHEYAIYKHLAKHFENESRIKFVIEENYFTYFSIYDKTIRFHHGHAFRYSGGIGGLYVPLMRFVLRANQQRYSFIDCMGHWHSHIHIPQAMINGSIVGFNAYASKLGMQPEPPSQQFQLIHSKKGFTLNFPILLD